MIVRKRLAGGGIIPGRPAQGFDEPQKRGQRRAQFVADIGHEIAAHLFGLFLIADVLKKAHGTTADRRHGDAVHDVLTGAGQNLTHHALLAPGKRRGDRRKNLGLAQGKTVVPPDDAAAQTAPAPPRWPR